jgi:hypothetical protein
VARYTRSLKDSGISLECETENVPADGRYHLLHDGKIVSSHRNLKMATAAYQALLEEMGVAPPPPPPPDPARLVGDYYVYGKGKRGKTGTRTFG